MFQKLLNARNAKIRLQGTFNLGLEIEVQKNAI